MSRFNFRNLKTTSVASKLDDYLTKEDCDSICQFYIDNSLNHRTCTDLLVTNKSSAHENKNIKFHCVKNRFPKDSFFCKFLIKFICRVPN